MSGQALTSEGERALIEKDPLKRPAQARVTRPGRGMTTYPGSAVAELAQRRRSGA